MPMPATLLPAYNPHLLLLPVPNQNPPSVLPHPLPPTLCFPNPLHPPPPATYLLLQHCYDSGAVSSSRGPGPVKSKARAEGNLERAAGCKGGGERGRGRVSSACHAPPKCGSPLHAPTPTLWSPPHYPGHTLGLEAEVRAEPPPAPSWQSNLKCGFFPPCGLKGWTSSWI